MYMCVHTYSPSTAHLDPAVGLVPLFLLLQGVPSPNHWGRPPRSALLWELQTCLFQDILLRMLYKCFKIYICL